MQVIYGTPLPPGLVAPTQGELRLRIDQLLLEDDAINHNPLVHLFDNTAAVVSAAGDASDNATTAAATAVSRSPNRFVVPVDYCAVGPIFWGETRPTAQGQPSTPHLRRGPVTLAYAIKVGPQQFAAYLQRMTASPQGGVQLDVFVPSSYSGRPPVTVGKARLALDQLQPGQPIHGWLPVVHRRSRASLQQTEDSGATGSTAAAAPSSSVREIPVGKVKVTVSVEYYPMTRPPPQASSGKHNRHSDVSTSSAGGGGGGGGLALPHAKTRRSARHRGQGGVKAAAHYLVRDGSASSSSEVEGDYEAIHLRGGDRLRAHPRLLSTSAGSTQDLSSVTHTLLEQGLRLRAQMDAAARGGSSDRVFTLLDGPHSAGHLFGRGGGGGGGGEEMRAGDEKSDAEDDIVLPVLDESNGEAAATAAGKHGGEDADDDDDDDTVYTSDASDEENFALQLQRDSEARDSRATQQSALVSREVREDPAAQQQQLLHRHTQSSQGSRLAAKSTVSGVGTAPASVELHCSSFTFAQTEATVDLHQLRLSVRLSSDITTTEPTPGPLSSYVHPVPLQQPSICLHFDVCSYSEDRSKLVVEVYKVVADVEVAEEDIDDAWEMRGPRHVAREELLGLSVVGLYRQSREIAFRDPVLNTTNVFAQLELRLTPVSGSEGAAAGPGPRLVPAVSPFMTPASDGVPLSSIAGSSVPPVTKSVPAAHPQHKSTGTPPAQSVSAAQDGELHTSAASCHPHAAREVSFSRDAAAAHPPTPPPLPANTSLFASERRRLRVVVHGAVELPRVAVAEQRSPGAPHTSSASSSSSPRFPLIASSPRLFPDAGVDAKMRYTEPSSFVTVEEIFQSTRGGLAGAGSRVEEEETPKTRASLLAMPNWYVDEARSGYYDRSAVAEQSCNPHYDYEVLLQLPEVKAQESPQEASTLTVARGRSVNDTTATTTPARGGPTAEALEEVQFNVWHSDPVRRGDGVSVDHGAVRTKARVQEERFWTCAAYMGTCRVDLRPLRFLPLIHGYYRVVCERTPHNATDEPCADTEANTIGYMRVSISLL